MSVAPQRWIGLLPFLLLVADGCFLAHEAPSDAGTSPDSDLGRELDGSSSDGGPTCSVLTLSALGSIPTVSGVDGMARAVLDVAKDDQTLFVLVVRAVGNTPDGRIRFRYDVSSHDLITGRARWLLSDHESLTTVEPLAAGTLDAADGELRIAVAGVAGEERAEIRVLQGPPTAVSPTVRGEMIPEGFADCGCFHTGALAVGSEGHHFFWRSGGAFRFLESYGESAGGSMGPFLPRRPSFGVSARLGELMVVASGGADRQPTAATVPPFVGVVDLGDGRSGTLALPDAAATPPTLVGGAVLPTVAWLTSGSGIEADWVLHSAVIEPGEGAATLDGESEAELGATLTDPLGLAAGVFDTRQVFAVVDQVPEATRIVWGEVGRSTDEERCPPPSISVVEHPGRLASWPGLPALASTTDADGLFLATLTEEGEIWLFVVHPTER
jgi:hypothetical protein